MDARDQLEAEHLGPMVIFPYTSVLNIIFIHFFIHKNTFLPCITHVLLDTCMHYHPYR